MKGPTLRQAKNREEESTHDFQPPGRERYLMF